MRVLFNFMLHLLQIRICNRRDGNTINDLYVNVSVI